MLSNERQDKLIAYLKERNSATVKELAAALYVSEATVRRDLAALQGLGILRRSHGGAVLHERADDISIFVRMTENAHEKERIAERALPLLPEFSSLFLDGSSTALALALRLDLTEKTVVTNSLQTAVRLAGRKCTLILPGGTVSPSGSWVGGGWTARHLAEFRFDLLLCSCAALDYENAYETSAEQCDVKRAAFDRARKKFLLADRSKLNAGGTHVLKALSSFDAVVFDELTEEERSSFPSHVVG